MSVPPWQNKQQQNVGIQNFQQQMSLQSFQQLNAAAAYGFHSQNAFNNQLNQMALGQNQIHNYPPRVNAIAFQQQPTAQPQSNPIVGGQQSNSKYNANIKTFSGTGQVTKIQNDIGFIDDEVLFHKNVCINGVPKVRDLVLVEATFNAKMPFKWNATRVQVLSPHQPASSGMAQESKSYNSSVGSQRESTIDSNSARRSRYSEERDRRARDDRRERSRDHRDDDADRKRRREEDRAERERRTERRETKSPKRRRTAVVPRYMVQIPKISLSLLNIDVLEARRRYSNLYVPSDFLFSENKWVNAFPPQKTFSLNRPCSFHIMKDVNPIDESIEKTVLDPSDADYSFSAKVMLMSLPTLEEIYKKCIVRGEDKDDKYDDYADKDFVHPTRLINFLVGVRGKNDTMAIGGPWSKKLDGENPDTDPSVLIKTAIRTTKALTGIDLSKCTQWYRFLELKYRRSEQVKGESIVKPARIETVVIFLPDIYSCMPNRTEWETLQQQYKQACEKFLQDPESDDDVQIIDETSQSQAEPTPTDTVGNNVLENSSGDNKTDDQVTADDTALSSQPVDDSTKAAEEVPASQDETPQEGTDESAMPIDEVLDESKEEDETKGEVTSPMDNLKNLKVTELRAELAARNLSTKGLKNELIERLQAVLNSQSAEPEVQSTDVEMTEVTPEDKPAETVETPAETQDSNDDGKEQEAEMNFAEMDISEVTVIDEYDSTKDEKPKASSDAKKRKPEIKKKRFDDKEKQMWEKKYQLPENSPSIIVHPSKTAKSGKFDCAVVSLSLLLDYSSKDTKEHSFEISLFAEAFNEMLMRDFGFKIYKSFNFLNSIKENEEKSKEKSTVEDGEKDTKTDDKKSSSKKEDSDSENSRSRREKDSKDKIKYVTVYPDLLLAFSYFDTTLCGYIFEKDIEELFFCLGLSLSRSQIRKLLEKFITRDSLYYRKITDRPSTVTVESDPLQSITDVQVAQLARGNNRIVEASTTQSSSSNEIVTVDGITVNVQQILHQMKRAEDAYQESEKNVVELRKSNSDLKSTNHRNEKKIKDLNSDLKSMSRKLQDAESSLSSMTRKYNDCYSVISSVYDRVTPIIRSKEKSRDHDRKSDKSDKKSSKDEKTSSSDSKSEKKVEKVVEEKEKEVKEVKPEPEEVKKEEENKPAEEEKVKEELP